jgi:rRNA biogenesis protein RRP5
MNGADETDEESESEAGSEDETGKPVHSKKRKSHAPYQDLTGDVHTKRPESTEEFERALVGSPNSSFLWVQYMSFQLELSEVDKAREIGRRALRTINYREEDEKLNVWMALLNLENAHGTAESFDKLFKEAAQYNDAETIHLRVAAVLTQTGKNEVSPNITPVIALSLNTSLLSLRLLRKSTSERQRSSARGLKFGLHSPNTTSSVMTQSLQGRCCRVA